MHISILDSFYCTTIARFNKKSLKKKFTIRRMNEKPEKRVRERECGSRTREYRLRKVLSYSFKGFSIVLTTSCCRRKTLNQASINDLAKIFCNFPSLKCNF